MITLVNFLWLLHYLMIGLYLFTIGQYAISRLQNPSIYRNLSDLAPGVQSRKFNALTDGYVQIAGIHVCAFGVYMEAVPIFLICLAILSAFADIKYDTAKDYIKAFKRQEAEEAARERVRRHQANQSGKSQSNFDFNEKAWNARGTGGQNSAQNQSPPDYQSALRDALQEANKISDARAEKFAKVWAKLAAEDGLSPKIRLFRELVSMLLAERAKGFKGRSDQSEPTQDEVAKLIAARPGR